MSNPCVGCRGQTFRDVDPFNGVRLCGRCLSVLDVVQLKDADAMDKVKAEEIQKRIDEAKSARRPS